jgi:hypothetical protein
LFVRLLICRTDKGIDSGTNHLELFNRALELSNVVALSDTKPHTLPPGFTFFRVQQSQVKASNMRVDKFILLLQVSNPDALERTSARLSDDKRLVIISMADPDKFVHNHRKAIASQLAKTLTYTSSSSSAAAAPEIQVEENYISSMSASYSSAVDHLTVENSDINLAMRKLYCVLPPGVVGSNEYFNHDGELVVCLHLSRPQHAHHLLDVIQNDDCQLQAYGVVVTDPVDLDEVSENGMVFEEFDDPKIDSDGRFLTIKANVFTNKEEVTEGPSNYCLDQFDNMYGDRDKGLFVAFQVAIKGSGQQHDIRPNGIAAKKSARERAFATRHRVGSGKSKSPRGPTVAADETRSDS